MKPVTSLRRAKAVFLKTGIMDRRAITYSASAAEEPLVYQKLDVEVESLRGLSLVGVVLSILTAFSLVSFCASFVYYRTGAHGRMRKFVLDLQGEKKTK